MQRRSTSGCKATEEGEGGEAEGVTEEDESEDETVEEEKEEKENEADVLLGAEEREGALAVTEGEDAGLIERAAEAAAEEGSEILETKLEEEEEKAERAGKEEGDEEKETVQAREEGEDEKGAGFGTTGDETGEGAREMSLLVVEGTETNDGAGATETGTEGS